MSWRVRQRNFPLQRSGIRFFIELFGFIDVVKMRFSLASFDGGTVMGSWVGVNSKSYHLKSTWNINCQGSEEHKGLLV